MKNTGLIPLTIRITNISSIVSCKLLPRLRNKLIQGDLTTQETVESGGNREVSCSYIGELPFSSNIQFHVLDAVTDFNLCFNSDYNIPVSISSGMVFLLICAKPSSKKRQYSCHCWWCYWRRSCFNFNSCRRHS